MSEATTTSTTAPGRRDVINPDPLLTVPEAAAYLGVPAHWMRRAIHERRLPVLRVGRNVRLRRSALDEYLAAHTTPARPRR